MNYNNIIDIKILSKVKFEKLEILSLNNNKIADIDVLGEVNFKKLNVLYMNYNNISDIKVLEKAKFDNLEILSLNNNKISDISILAKVYFKELKQLYLISNTIINMEILKILNFKKLEFIDLSNNILNFYSLRLDSKESINNFFEYFKQIEFNPIEIKEHNHKLTLCISLLDWKCSLCKRTFKKEYSRYYCSLCEFNMCTICHSNGNYIKKKYFPKNILPSNKGIKNPILKINYHQHNLLYCRSSRLILQYNDWKCDICRKNFTNDI